MCSSKKKHFYNNNFVEIDYIDLISDNKSWDISHIDNHSKTFEHYINSMT